MRSEPIGKYHVQVCTTTPCMVRGAYEIFDTVKSELGTFLRMFGSDFRRWKRGDNEGWLVYVDGGRVFGRVCECPDDPDQRRVLRM